MFRLLLPLVALCVLINTAQAQLQVGLQIKRRLFVLYEPIIAKVYIRNLSGRDIPLVDKDNKQWFSFQIFEGERPIAAHNPDYTLEPLVIPAGQTVERRVVLNTLYPVNSYGTYHVKAMIYFGALDQYYESPNTNVDITEGRKIWQETVGVPDGFPGAGGTRRITVLAFRQPNYNYLYVRVENGEDGTVYCTHPIGRLITGIEPEIQLDQDNNLHVLHLTGAKLYLHTQVGLNGEVVAQNNYLAAPTRPSLRLRKSGELAVVGGVIQNKDTVTNEMGVPAAPKIPKLSDRPVTLPKG